MVDISGRYVGGSARLTSHVTPLDVMNLNGIDIPNP